jgi:hypothetical protein
MPQARCGFHCQFDLLLPRPPLPFRTFTSLRIKAFSRFRRQSVRLPNPPDLLSLPAARSIASFGCGSTFLVRYVSGGSLFLKPLGTFPTMRPKQFSVNVFLVRSRTFPQYISALFRMSYGTSPVNWLCIKQRPPTLFYRISLRIMPLSVAMNRSWSPAPASMVRLATAR